MSVQRIAAVATEEVRDHLSSPEVARRIGQQTSIFDNGVIQSNLYFGNFRLILTSWLTILDLAQGWLGCGQRMCPTEEDGARDAMSGTFNFIQIAARKSNHEQHRRGAAEALRRTAKKLGDPVLSILATKVELDVGAPASASTAIPYRRAPTRFPCHARQG